MGLRVAMFIGVFVVLLLGARFVMARSNKKQP